MSIKLFVQELWDLIKKQRKLIILTALIVLILTAGVQFLLMYDFSNAGQTPATEAEGATATVDFIIEEEEGAFTNSYLIEILAQQPEIVQEVEETTGVEIQPLLDEFAEMNTPIYTSEDPINAERNTSSNVITLYITIGSDEENLRVAQTYYNWLENPEHSFFENKDIYLISDPELIDEETEAAIQTSTSTSSLIINIVVFSFIGLILGIVLGIVLALMKALFSEKINYGFAYGWNSDDIYLKLDDSETEDTIVRNILKSENDELAVLSEYELPKRLQLALDKAVDNKIEVYSDMREVPLNKDVGEYVLIIQRNRTYKNWYHEQRKELKIYPSSTIKIVEISE